MAATQKFVDFLDDWGGDFCVFFVETESSRVAAACSTLAGSEFGLCAVRVAGANDTDRDPSGVIVGLQENRWTIVLHSVGTRPRFHVDPAAFAKHLNCRVLRYFGSTTACMNEIREYDETGLVRWVLTSDDAEAADEYAAEFDDGDEAKTQDVTSFPTYDVVESYAKALDDYGINAVVVHENDDGALVADESGVSLITNCYRIPRLKDGG